MSGNEEEQVLEPSQEHGSASDPPSKEDEQDAALVLVDLQTTETDIVMSKRAAKVGQKRPRDPEEPTPTGKKRLSKGETRVRPLQKFITHLSGKTRNFRLATAAAAAHAEDCYMMWSFWNEDPEKKIDIEEHLFRYSPSIYLNDTELQQALKKITTADEMEEFLKARYKTKKEERPGKRRLNRITSNNSRNTVSQKSLPANMTETPAEAVPSSIAELPAPAEQQQQVQPTSATAMNMDDGASPSKLVSTSKQDHGMKEGPAKEEEAPFYTSSIYSGKTDQEQLSLAARVDDHKMITKLVDEETVDIDAPDPKNGGKTPLMLAATNGSTACLKVLIDAGADLELRDREELTAAKQAARNHKRECLELLLDRGAKFSPQADVTAALLRAAKSSNFEYVELILKNGADINGALDSGETVLMVAAQHASAAFINQLFGIVQITKEERVHDRNPLPPSDFPLERYELKIDAKDKAGQTALMHAARRGCQDIVKTLLEEGADVNMVDEEGRTALMHAAMLGLIENVQTLVKKRAPIKVGLTLELVDNALKEAKQNKNADLEDRLAQISDELLEFKGRNELLEFKGRNYDSDTDSDTDKGRNYDSDTMTDQEKLFYAAYLDHADIIKKLIDGKTVDINAPDPKSGGKTPLRMRSFDPKNRVDLKSRLAQLSKKLKAGKYDEILEKEMDADQEEEVEEGELEDGEILANQKNVTLEKDLLEGSPSKKSKKVKGSGVDSSSGESIAITVDTPAIKSDPKLVEIVRKATDGKLMDTAEVETLLLKASMLPRSDAPPPQPAAGSLFVYHKGMTPNYKKDGHGFGKESHTKLFIDKKARIKVYYGTKHDPPLQRRSYSLIITESDDLFGDDWVLVHYLVPQVNVAKSKSVKFGGSEDQAVSGSLEKPSAKALPAKYDTPTNQENYLDKAWALRIIDEEETANPSKPTAGLSKPVPTASHEQQSEDNIEKSKQLYSAVADAVAAAELAADELADWGRSRDINDSHTPSKHLRALVAIGARLKIPGLDVDVLFDAVNEACDNPPPGCEAAKNTKINFKTLIGQVHDLMGVYFGGINAEMKEKWDEIVNDDDSAEMIKQIRDVVVIHLKGSLVPESVIEAFKSASVDKLPSMASALASLRKVPTIPEKEVMKFINMIAKAPEWWTAVQFTVIRDAVIDGDILYAKGSIEQALLDGPPEK